MSDEELQQLIGEYAAALDFGDDLNKRMLVNLCREVERRTRQAAVRSMWAAANAIDERVDVRHVLATRS